MAGILGKASTEPEFSLKRSKYDMSTFWGRFQRNLEIIDPRTLFTSKAELARCRGLIDAVREGKTLPQGTTNHDLWEAKRVVDAIIHPDTGLEIPLPLRMSAYIPLGVPIRVGMTQPGMPTSQIVFWQGINQTYNAAVNLANSNATKKVSTTTILEGYVGACLGAFGISATAMKLVKTLDGKISPRALTGFRLCVPAISAGCANVVNVVLMRRGELQNGILVNDSQGDVVGSSKLAAQVAVSETAMTRAFLSGPTLIIPPFLVEAMRRRGMFAKRPWLALVASTAAITVTFSLTLPTTLSFFDQQAVFPVAKLEKELQGRKDAKGNPITHVYFNKGL